MAAFTGSPHHLSSSSSDGNSAEISKAIKKTKQYHHTCKLIGKYGALAKKDCNAEEDKRVNQGLQRYVKAFEIASKLHQSVYLLNFCQQQSNQFMMMMMMNFSV